MRIFLDTNIFYNDWFMKSANFKYLFNYINNEDHTLIISSLVITEAENIRNRELDIFLTNFKNSIKNIQKLNANSISFNKDNLGIEPYKLLSLIKLKTELIEEIGYNNILHSEIVSRALINKKPFLEGEKGYRDTLIWLSLLDFLSSNTNKEDVAFITNNKNDFLKIKDDVAQFHPDLISDIEEKISNIKLIPFESLHKFIESTVDKEIHVININETQSLFESFFEESSISFIEGLSNNDLASYFENDIFSTTVKDVLNIKMEVIEGVEDPELFGTSRLDKNDIYITYGYNLRGVAITIEIPAIDYSLNKLELDKIFYEVNISEDIASMVRYCRTYFNVSFIYDEKENLLKTFGVDSLWIK